MSTDPTTDLAAIDLGLAELRACAANSEAWLRKDPEVSGWSVAQQVHHAALVAGFVGMGARRLLRTEGAEGLELAAAARALLESGDIPRGVAVAPDNFVPDDEPDAGTVLSLLDKAERNWGKLRGQEESIASGTAQLPHPILGPLNISEWVRFANIHTEHHLKIVREILGLPAGPVQTP